MTQVTRPPSCVRECRNWHIQYVCDHMRPDEIDQYEAFYGPFSPDVAAQGFINTAGMKFTVIGPDGMPAACGGYHEVARGVWQSWMAGTPEGWEKCWRSITKASLWVMDGLFEMGARRLQTNALASRTRAIDWYEKSLRLEREGTFRAYGANGEDVALFSRVRMEAP